MTFTLRHLNICVTTVFFLDENPKTGFSNMKKSKKPKKIEMSSKEISEVI